MGRSARILALLSVWMAVPAEGAQYVTAEFASTVPTTVVADVVDLATGTQVGNNLAATQLSRDSATQALWRIDLSTVAGFPAACEPKSYLVTFVPDGANCNASGGSPELCAVIQIDANNQEGCSPASTTHVDYYHSATVVSAQGISQAVLDYYARRGASPITWRQVRVARTGNFASPEKTYWEVYFYRLENQIPALCTVYTTTDPSSSLPSSAQCH